MKHGGTAKIFGFAAAAIVLVACGPSPQDTANRSPVASSSAATYSTPSPNHGVSPSPVASPSAAPAVVRLVISDYTKNQVRLARLDGTDTAAVSGNFDGVVADQVLVLQGLTLRALRSSGAVRTLGKLVSAPDWVGPGTVAVNPQLSEWLYAVRDSSYNAVIHLGTPTADKVIARLPPPDVNSFYRPFIWNSSGVYMVKQPVGIGGAGPFLEYDFPLARFNMGTKAVTDVSPKCTVHQVLEDGTLICGEPNIGGRLEVRSPSGLVNVIQVGTAGGDNFVRVALSVDQKRLVVGRNGASGSSTSYQMAVAGLTSSSAAKFGPLDYLPDVWLPDGRLVADHECVIADWGGGPCNASLDGTYFFSADGSSHTLFYKLSPAVQVVAYI